VIEMLEHVILSYKGKNSNEKGKKIRYKKDKKMVL